jgi:hypothetical protein
MSRLSYGENHSKLVHFKEQKRIFCIKKNPNLEQFSPLHKHGKEKPSKSQDCL